MGQPTKKPVSKNTGKNTDGKIADDNETASEAIDVGKVRFLVGLMKDNNLTELEIQQGTTKIRLKRGNEAADSAAVSAPPYPVLPALTQPAVSTPAAPAVPVQEKNTQIIKSPMVGTFYSSPNPESPAFVRVGDNISADTTVCLIEAMKVYNDIQAECAGKITAVLVKNGSAVEFGSPLFEVVVNL